MHRFLIMYTFLYSVHIHYPITISVKLQKEKSLQMFRIFFAASISAQMIPYIFRRLVREFLQFSRLDVHLRFNEKEKFNCFVF